MSDVIIVKRNYLKVFDVSRLQLGDVPVPEVVDDLGEVDTFCQRPRYVLTYAWGRKKNC